MRDEEARTDRVIAALPGTARDLAQRTGLSLTIVRAIVRRVVGTGWVTRKALRIGPRAITWVYEESHARR